jgi:hypothetical protein
MHVKMQNKTEDNMLLRIKVLTKIFFIKDNGFNVRSYLNLLSGQIFRLEVTDNELKSNQSSDDGCTNL